VLFYIPEGNKNESPTSYMSITNQKYYTTTVAEANESKPKAGAKDTSNKENNNVKKNNSNDLNEKVRVQADLVRTIKANKASKVYNLFFIQFLSYNNSL
jgi:hypothetical protein